MAVTPLQYYYNKKDKQNLNLYQCQEKSLGVSDNNERGALRLQ